MARRPLLRALVAPAALVLSLLPAGAASADPLEGCTGFPSIPEAYVCVTQWSPENAVPTVTPGPGTTFEIPEFCVSGNCVGPTPVTVPDAVVTHGDGVVAVITYNGSTHTVQVPPLGDPVATVDALLQLVSETLAGLVAAAEEALRSSTFSVTAVYQCFGCGSTTGTLSGTFNGTINGVQYTNAPMSGSFSASVPSSACPHTHTASGFGSIAGHSTSFTWTQTGPLLSVTFSGGVNGSATALFQITAPAGNPCGLSATASITGVADT